MSLPVAPDTALRSKRRKTRSEEPYIYRREARGKSGANQRVVIQRNGNTYTKSFFDSQYDSPAHALDAARLWRDQTFAALPAFSKAEAVTRLRSNMVSGVRGVRRVWKVDKNGHLHEWWAAYRPRLSGKSQQSKVFSIEKYGERRAFAIAVWVRAAFVAQLSTVPHLPMYAAKVLAERIGKNVIDAELSEPSLTPIPEASQRRKTIERKREGFDAVSTSAIVNLLDLAKLRLGLNSDFELSKALRLPPKTISRLRNERMAIDVHMLRRFRDVAGIEAGEIEVDLDA